MLVEKGRSWRGERWARPERQQRRAHSARALRCEGEGAAAGEAAARSAAAASLSSGGRRAVALSILERDGRDTQMPLRPIGGIGACAVGDLAKARGLAADAGWLSAHAADKHGSTALMWASGGGHLPVVRWLCEEVGVAVDAANKDRRTALQWACKTGQCEVAAYLLDVAGADPTLRMKDGSSAFDWAVLSGDVPSMELLASHPRVDIAALNKFGCAAVQWAAAAGSVATLRWLQSKRLSLGHVNDANHGAVVKAAWKGRREALEWLLLAADGPQLVEQLDLLDLEGRTVADLARQNGQGHVATWLDGLIRERSGGANGVGTS